MIHPVKSTSDTKSSTSDDVCYKIVAWQELPAFDPVPMVKTVLLSPSSVKKFNQFVLKAGFLIWPSVIAGTIFRFAAFATPAPVGRILAPLAAILQIPGTILTLAQMRVEYIKLILRTFDFWFLELTNTVWSIVFSAVLQDMRAVLVITSWITVTLWLLQEAYLKKLDKIVGSALFEWLFFIVLVVAISLEFVDDVHHYDLLVARHHTLSTKDVLVNVMGTMIMLSSRNLYQRYRDAKDQRKQSTRKMKALSYRCHISLSVPEFAGPACTNIAGSNSHRPSRSASRLTSGSANVSNTNQPLLQMTLATESARFDSRDTVWPRVGSLTPLSTWRSLLLHVCAATGGGFATLSLLLPKTWNSSVIDGMAVLGLIASALVNCVYACCYQRQLLNRLMTSFHCVFLGVQICAASLCLLDIFEMRWAPVCGVISTQLLANTVLTIDALTPNMKRRLHLKFWMPITAIVLYVLVHSLLILDVLVFGHWDLQDRVFLDFTVFGRRTQFRSGPFLWSRLLTVFVWAGRYVYAALIRPDDNALVLLRGNIEFDYDSWKRVNFERRGAKGAQ